MGRKRVEIRNYDDLIRALRDRTERVNCSRSALDEVAGLCDGYCGKILGFGRSKRIGPASMGPLLGALGVKLLMVPDEAARPNPYANTRRRNQVRLGVQNG